MKRNSQATPRGWCFVCAELCLRHCCCATSPFGEMRAEAQLGAAPCLPSESAGWTTSPAKWFCGPWAATCGQFSGSPGGRAGELHRWWRPSWRPRAREWAGGETWEAESPGDLWESESLGLGAAGKRTLEERGKGEGQKTGKGERWKQMRKLPWALRGLCLVSPCQRVGLPRPLAACWTGDENLLVRKSLRVDV